MSNGGFDGIHDKLLAQLGKTAWSHSKSSFKGQITVAITGASGAPYALRLLQQLVAADYQVLTLMSSAARVVFGGRRRPENSSRSRQSQ